jgi:hypothetical protein
MQQPSITSFFMTTRRREEASPDNFSINVEKLGQEAKEKQPSQN